MNEKRQWKTVVALVLAGVLIIMTVIGLLWYEKPEPRAVRERIAIDSRSDCYLYNGADWYAYSDNHSTQKFHVDGATGNLDVEGAADVAGDLTVGGTASWGCTATTIEDDLTVTGTLTAEDVTITDTLTVGGDIDLDGDGFDVNITSAFSIDADAASNINVAGAGVDLTIESEAGRIIVKGDEAAANAIHLDANDAVTTGIDIDVGSASGLAIDGGLTNIGGGTCGVADGDNDVCIAGVLEVDDEFELDGALDADSTANIQGAVTLQSTLDTAGTATFAGITALAGEVENFLAPSLTTASYTFTVGAGGTATLATIADGEVWLILGCYANVTTNWDVIAGDDATFDVGDGGDPDGLLDLDDAELQAADTEGTGAIAGWQGFMSSDTRGAYMAQTPFVYASSGADETIDVAWGATGDDLTAGGITVYLFYVRIK